MWEYKVAETDLHGGSIAELLKSYNEFELVSIVPAGWRVILVFKRPEKLQIESIDERKARMPNVNYATWANR